MAWHVEPADPVSPAFFVLFVQRTERKQAWQPISGRAVGTDEGDAFSLPYHEGSSGSVAINRQIERAVQRDAIGSHLSDHAALVRLYPG